MLTPEILLTAGYRQFTDPSGADRLGDWYRASYQKQVWDDVGLRYFITVRHGIAPAHAGNPARAFFTPANQFTVGGTVFNVEMLHHDESLAEVEAFFERMWTTMRLDYYEGGPDQTRRLAQSMPA